MAAVESSALPSTPKPPAYTSYVADLDVGERKIKARVLKMTNSFLLFVGEPTSECIAELGIASLLGSSKQTMNSIIIGPTDATVSVGLAMKLTSRFQRPVLASVNIDTNPLFILQLEEAITKYISLLL